MMNFSLQSESALCIIMPCFLTLLGVTPASHYSPVAQLVERVAVNHLVGGSSPSGGANYFIANSGGLCVDTKTPVGNPIGVLLCLARVKGVGLAQATDTRYACGNRRCASGSLP